MLGKDRLCLFFKHCGKIQRLGYGDRDRFLCGIGLVRIAVHPALELPTFIGFCAEDYGIAYSSAQCEALLRVLIAEHRLRAVL